MTSLLQSISLFPQSRFWRVKGEAKVQDSFGGIASLLLFITVGAILTVQMVDVFKRKTVTVRTEETIESSSVEGVIQTSEINENTRPTMVAFKIDSFLFDYHATYKSQNGTQNIALQTCTVNHFHGVQNIDYYFNWYQMNQFLCLPMNTSYVFGGGRLANQFNFLEISVFCLGNVSGCAQSNLDLIILSSAVNPNNNTQPWINYLKRYSYLGSGIQNMTHRMVQNTLQSLNGLFPLDKQEQISTGYQLEQTIQKDQLASSASTMINFIFTTSQKKIVHKRSYLTVVDALSYVGGVFNALFAAFVFMKIYGQFFFEMFFAEIYFKSKEAGSFGFFSFLKQIIFNALTYVGCKPRWDLSEKREKLRQTVQNAMNVVYLQRRIDFLEKSMTVLLDRHHLKGLHLLHRLTQKQANDQFKEHRFRDRLIGYFRMRNKEGYGKNDGENASKSQNQGRSRKILLKNGKDQIIHQKTESASSLRAEMKDNVKAHRISVNSNDETAKNMELKDNDKSKHTFKQSVQKRESKELDKSAIVSSIEEDYFDDYEYVQEENYLEIQEDLENDLRKLMKEAEAEGNGSDGRSRRIVEGFDRQMKQWIKESIKQTEGMYRFQYTLCE